LKQGSSEVKDGEEVEEIEEKNERSAVRFSLCPPAFLSVKSFDLVVALAMSATQERIE
jgi:hypothetical protein